MDNGQLTPKPVSTDTGGAGNFTIPHPMDPQLTDSPRNNTQPAVRHKKSPDYLRVVGDGVTMLGVTAASIFLTPETGGLSDAAGITADAALTAELEDALATETEDVASQAVAETTAGENEIINTNLGREIDITRYGDYNTTTINPGYQGSENSTIDIIDRETGEPLTRRWFDSNGRATRDVDFTDHGNPANHPEVPHEHIWEYGPDGKPSGRPLIK